MGAPLKLAVVGVGRIGIYHALHAQELARQRGDCELVAVVDGHAGTAGRALRQLQPLQDTRIELFDDVEALATAGVCDAAVIASRTADHHADAKRLIDTGRRVLLEKPLTDSLESATAFAAYLNGDNERRNALMLAFMRRYDAALAHARDLVEGGAIGRLFKLVSVLEDPYGPPDGYSSAGLLVDMAVHNADEVMWLTGGRRPMAVTGTGSRLHNQKVSSVAEDFDDGFIQMWFDDDLVAQVQVSRNHVAGYRNETVLYGEAGMIHVGAFRGDPSTVTVDHYDRDGRVDGRAFPVRPYDGALGDGGAPVFIERFGNAYVAELSDFLDRCVDGQPFAVDHDDGLRAQQVVVAAMQTQQTRAQAAPLAWKPPS